MSFDLQQELARVAGSVHDDVVAERMSGQVRTMVGRIRRRRAARHTAQGVVGIGAVAAVALAGMQLADSPEAPPAGPTDEPDPHLLDPAEDACGLTLAELGWTGVGPVSLAPYEEPPTGRDDGGFTAATHVVKSADVELRMDAGPVRHLAVDPGTGEVVGVPWPGTYDDEVDWASAVEELDLDPEQAQEFMSSTSMTLRDCDADPDSGVEPNLGAGTYDLHAMQVLHPVETFEGLDTFVAVGGPWPIEVPARPGTDDPGASDEEDLTSEEHEALVTRNEMMSSPLENPDGIMPRCGAQAVLDDGSRPLVLDRPFEDGHVEVVDGRFETTVTMRTRDGQYVIGNAAGSGATLVLMKEDVVVGYQWLDAEDLILVDLQPGETLEIPLRGNNLLCGTGEGGTGDELRLPADTYEAVAVVDVMLKEVGVPGGGAEAVTQTVPVMSEPFSIEITGP